MAKTSAKNVRNALKRIGVNENSDENNSVFCSPVTNYQITLIEIQSILDKQPVCDNFQLLRIIIDEIIKLNQTNHLALFVCYELLNRYAAEYGDQSFKSYSEKAMFHHLNWKLTGEYPYAMIISNRCCERCGRLNELCDTTLNIHNVLMNAVKECESTMCRCTVVTLTESGYQKRQ